MHWSRVYTSARINQTLRIPAIRSARAVAYFRGRGELIDEGGSVSAKSRHRSPCAHSFFLFLPPGMSKIAEGPCPTGHCDADGKQDVQGLAPWPPSENVRSHLGPRPNIKKPKRMPDYMKAWEEYKASHGGKGVEEDTYRPSSNCKLLSASEWAQIVCEESPNGVPPSWFSSAPQKAGTLEQLPLLSGNVAPTHPQPRPAPESSAQSHALYVAPSQPQQHPSLPGSPHPLEHPVPPMYYPALGAPPSPWGIPPCHPSTLSPLTAHPAAATPQISPLWASAVLSPPGPGLSAAPSHSQEGRVPFKAIQAPPSERGRRRAADSILALKQGTITITAADLKGIRPKISFTGPIRTAIESILACWDDKRGEWDPERAIFHLERDGVKWCIPCKHLQGLPWAGNEWAGMKGKYSEIKRLVEYYDKFPSEDKEEFFFAPLYQDPRCPGETIMYTAAIEVLRERWGAKAKENTAQPRGCRVPLAKRAKTG